MNYIDISFLSLIAFVTVRGLFRGLITELMVLAAIVLGFMVATVSHPLVESQIINFFPDLAPGIAKVIAFVSIFVLINIFIRIFSRALNKIATFTFLQPVNKVAGAVFAFTKITLILSIILVVIDFIPGSDFLLDSVGKEESYTYRPVKNFAPFLWDLFFANSNKSFKDIIPFDSFNADSTAKELLKKL